MLLEPQSIRNGEGQRSEINRPQVSACGLEFRPTHFRITKIRAGRNFSQQSLQSMLEELKGPLGWPGKN
jgi:hypothetical protein